jgi:hypothetical protein
MEERPKRNQRSRTHAMAAPGIGGPSLPGRIEEGAPRRAEDLHVCPDCGSSLVIPIDWAPAPNDRWRVVLRCPECEWTGGGSYTQQIVDRFDEVLDLGTEALLKDLNLLARANMEEEVDRFVSALNADHIVPADF